MATDPIERILRHADRPLKPRDAFADALLDRLLAQLEGTTESDVAKEDSMTTEIAFPAPAIGRSAPRPAWWREARQAGHKRRGWVLTDLATAALLLLTIVSAFFAFGGPRSWAFTGRSTPQAVDELIARAEVTELGPYVSEYTGINRFVLDPGESVTLGPESEWGDALYLFLVESGTVGMTVDGPAVLGTGEEGAATSIASDAEVILTAGDRGAVQPGTPGTWRNAGSEPATLLEAPIGEAVDISSLGIEYKEVVYAHTIAWSQFPAVFALHRLTFEPGASLPVSDLPGLMMLGVDAGSLDVSLQTGQGTPTRTRDFDAGEGLRTDVWQIAPDGEFRNSGAEPAVVYALLGESAGSAATPTP
jgi:hypothetical protein